MEKKWQYRKLGDVCIVERGGSPRPIDQYITDDENGINWIKIGDTTESMFITETAQKIKSEGMKKSRYVQPGDFLLSNSMSFGRPYILKIDGCIHDGWLVLRDKEELFDKRFLYYYLSSKTTYHKFKGMAVGGVVNNLNSDMVRKVEVPVPSKVEQAEIADLLDKLNSVILMRQQELEKLDDLIKARFVELFGNLDINDKGWNECSLGETCDKVIRYPTFYGMEYLETGTRVIRIGNILEDGHMELADENYVFVYDGVNEDFPETVMELNDIVMAVRGDGSAAKRIGIIREEELIDSNISPNLIRIKAGKELEPLFLFYYLTGDVGQRRLDTYVNKTAKKNIAAKDIVKVIVPIPPLLVQKQFADFVNQVDKSKVMNVI